MKELTLGEFKDVLNYLLDNNVRLIDSGDTPISVCLEGEAGIGKTQVVQQIAAERGMTFVKVNLAQIEEPAELVGFPYKEQKVIDANGGVQWMSIDVLREINCDFQITNESRMAYAVPAWVPREFNPNGTMLVLDDFSRANSLIIQAIMEIINTGSYISWSLPRYTNIVLTSNPDNGEYNVTGLDFATKSRMLTFGAKFNIDEWVKWAESFGLDYRAINFAMYYHHELFEPKNNVVIANARSYTTLCRSIGSIKDWSTTESLSLILQIASGCFAEDKDNVAGGLFTSFIANKLDRLITPERMINGPWESVALEIEQCVYKENKYSANIASILGSRLRNYCERYLGSDQAKPNVVVDRISQIYLYSKEGPNKKDLIASDVLTYLLKRLMTDFKSITNKWTTNRYIRDIIIS